ncbi:MAG: nucleotide exchange factor GrpE [Pseudomonadota bacterium]
MTEETSEPIVDASVSEIETLKAQLAEAQAKSAENLDKALRAHAELENVRRRAEREVSGAYKFALERALGDLLPVADSLEQGLKVATLSNDKAMAEGMGLTQKQLLAFLEKNGVKVIDPQGQPFSADKHEAVSMIESADVPPNHVLSVMQKGYSLHERLLRPAMVVVAKTPTPAS